MPDTKKPVTQDEEQASPIRMQAEVVEDDASAGSGQVTEVPVVKPSSVKPTEVETSTNPSITQAPAAETVPPVVSPPVAPTPAPQPMSQPEMQVPNLSQPQGDRSLMDTPGQGGGGAGENTRGVNYDSSMGGLDSSVPLEKKNRKMFGIGIIILAVVLAGLAFVLYQRSQLPPVTTGEETVEASPVVMESTPTPTPAPETGLERGEITVEVLNGSGVTGAAGVFAEKLENLGYEIGEVGNATATDQNELYVQEELEEELSVLYNDLKDELGIGEVTGYLEDSEATARVVLGAEEEASPSPSPDEEASDSATTE